MKLTAKTIDTINLRLEKVKEFITVNNGEDLDKKEKMDLLNTIFLSWNVKIMGGTIQRF